MGSQQYRVIRTRTKAGRGTLALHMGVASSARRRASSPRRHYTYRIGPEEVADFIRTGEITRRPPELIDAIVRVRYSCTAEQDKALNRAKRW